MLRIRFLPPPSRPAAGHPGSQAAGRATPGLRPAGGPTSPRGPASAGSVRPLREVAPLAVGATGPAETAPAFLQQVRAPHPTDPLIVIGDNGPAQRGYARRTDWATPDRRRRLVAWPG